MPQSSIKNCIKFAQSNRQNSSEMLFGLVCQNVFGTDWCMWPSVTGIDQGKFYKCRLKASVEIAFY
jgi:hypothetical protein